MSGLSVTHLKEKIQKFHRVDLIHLPTPFSKLENLSKELNGPEIFIKRDDLTGLAFGGNKSRKLEFIIADVLKKKADVIITWASVQSNWCLQVAAAARKFGITPVLILFKTSELPDEYDGNLLLDFILEADITIRGAGKRKVVSEKEVQKVVANVIAKIKKSGHMPYVAPSAGSMVGGSMEIPLGAISYINAFIELLNQVKDQGINVNYIIHAAGSGGTQAGLTIGAKALTNNAKVLGISVSEEKDFLSEKVLKISKDTLNALNIDLEIKKDDIFVFDEYIKGGYGIIDKEVSDMIRLVAKKEAIFLDPIYTGKAMVGLIDLINRGYFRKYDKIVFFHTGGTATLFPYKHFFTK